MAGLPLRSAPGRSDLLAGMAAAVLLVILVFGVRLDFWLGLVLALATYLGVRLALPTRSSGGPAELTEAEALREARRLVESLRLLARKRSVARSAGWRADPVARIAEAAGRVFAAIEEEPSRRPLAPWVVREHLTPIHAIVTHYVRLRDRGVSAAEPALVEADTETLPKIERVLGELHDRLYREDVIDLKVQSELLDLRDELPPAGAR